ncbi:MAG TPA: T9SS type A sorting domain-containing protein [Flavobacterium sp.]|jgi:hypothetical protein
MIQLKRSIHLVLLFLSTTLIAQTTILNESLLTPSSFSSFTPISVTGAQTWNYSSQYGAMCSGYAAMQTFENEDWFISPAMNLVQMDNVKLTFNHTRGNAAVLNAGLAEGWYKVFATANFTGDPATTEWVEIENVNHSVPTAWQFIPSGELVFPNAAKSESSRIAFRYISSAFQSATWEIKNVKVTGEIQGNPGTDAGFKITNWNTEWLGCYLNGPTDEDLQVSNIVAAMLEMNSDIYCLQEVSNSSNIPTIMTLVSLLGSDQWAGAIAPTDTGDCSQRQGIIYKKSKVQLLNSSLLSSGYSAQGGSYPYNWSNGRFPALYNVNFVVGSALIPVSLVNIHAKAEDNNSSSYYRRMGASEALKTILDGPDYNTKNVVIVGDFNDFLFGTTSSACNCSDSPYKNFMDDTINYSGVTSDIMDANINWGVQPIIENIIISNELAETFVSAAQDVEIAQEIDNYMNTTSNHLPISAFFNFTSLGTVSQYNDSTTSMTLYPNPVKDELNIEYSGTRNGSLEIYDLTGRKVNTVTLSGSPIDVSDLPVGMYIVRLHGTSQKFAKK